MVIYCNAESTLPVSSVFLTGFDLFSMSMKGEEAGELDSFVRFLVMRLLNSLKGKALNYVRDGRDDSQV